MTTTDPTQQLRDTLAKMTRQVSPFARSFLADLPIALDQYIGHVEARLQRLEGGGGLANAALSIIKHAEKEGQL